MNDGEAMTCQLKDAVFGDVDGFNNEDLEKPNFPEKSASEKVPYVLSAPGETVVQVPATINQYLRRYQQLGIAFLYKQYCNDKGAILADDMGLGKTVQVIGFISAVLGKSGTKSDIYKKFSQKTVLEKNTGGAEKGSFLIVCPHSVLYNWLDELATWGYFQVGNFHNNKRDETLKKALMDKLDVVLTTYDTFRNHWESLNQVKWLALIMDEVHHLKDPKTAVTLAAKSLDVKCRIGLTGTPLQNRFVEFWCVLDWANPGCLGKKEDFVCNYGKPIMQAQRFDVSKRELATGRKKSQEFQMMINEWCLRRTKNLLSDQLPTKDQKVVFCPLSKLQEDIYKTLLQTPDVQLVLRQGEICDCTSQLRRGYCCYSENKEGFSMKQLTLQYLRILLKVSNHAALLLSQVKQSEEQRKRAGDICEKVFSAHPYFKEASKLPSIELFSDSDFCGKMKVLDELLKLFQRQQDKVLLFSYSTQLLDILESYVVSCGFVYRRLDGKTRGEHRFRVVKEFNTVPGIFLFLISTKAGGVGLNLTSANVVVVFDPSWNPADDLQAEDRAYRIGQRKDVQVFRMISAGTVEENMYLRQVYKQQLANVALEGNNERRYFTAVDGVKDKKGELFGIENLFTLRNDGCCVSNDIFKRSDTSERGFKLAKYQLQPHKIEDKQSSVDTDDVEDQKYDLDEVTSEIMVDEQQSNDNSLLTNRASDVQGTECLDNKQDTGFTKIKQMSGMMGKRYNKELWKIQKNLKKGLFPKDEVNQILADCGVQHTHSNKLGLATSKAENEMTARALKDVFELGQFSQQPANCFTTIQSDSEESDDIGDNTEENKSKTNECKNPNIDGTKCTVENSKNNHDTSVPKIGNTSVLFGKTPKTIRRCQFSEIAKSQRYGSDVDFAKDVLSSSTTDRVELLKKYYECKNYPKHSSLYYSCKANVEKTERRRSRNVLSAKFSSSRRRQSSRKRYKNILNEFATGKLAIPPNSNADITTQPHNGEPLKGVPDSTLQEQRESAQKNDTIAEQEVAGTSTPADISGIERTRIDCKDTNHVNLSSSAEDDGAHSCFLDLFLQECSQLIQSKSAFSVEDESLELQPCVFEDLI